MSASSSNGSGIENLRPAVRRHLLGPMATPGRADPGQGTPGIGFPSLSRDSCSAIMNSPTDIVGPSSSRSVWQMEHRTTQTAMMPG